MKFTTELLDEKKSPTIEEVIRGIESIDGERCHFAILDADDGSFVQTWGDLEEGFEFEYQSMDSRKHLRAKKPDIGVDEVKGLFLAFYYGDRSWYDEYEWEESDLGSVEWVGETPKRTFQKGIKSTVSIERTRWEKLSGYVPWILIFLFLLVFLFKDVIRDKLTRLDGDLEGTYQLQKQIKP